MKNDIEQEKNSPPTVGVSLGSLVTGVTTIAAIAALFVVTAGVSVQSSAAFASGSEAVALDESRIYTVYLVTPDYAKEHNWGTANAIRVGLGIEYFPEGAGWSAFILNHTWPGSMGVDGAVYDVGSVLVEARRYVTIPYNVSVEDYILEEVGGHEVLRWGHDVQNVVMNQDLALNATAEEWEYSREELRFAVSYAYDSFRVTVGHHP